MIINTADPVRNSDILPPAVAHVGVDGELANAPGMMMGRVVLPAGSRTQRQFSVNSDFALFIVEGAGELLTGPAHAAEKDTFEEKDFVFIERGEIFTIANTSDAACTIVFTLVGANTVEEIDRQFVEAPLT